MKRKDHILILTSGLLTAKDTQTDTWLTTFAPYYLFDGTGTPGSVSLGGGNEPGQRLPFTTWIRSLKDEQIDEILFHPAPEQSDIALPAHIRAAFLGGDEELLTVRTKTATRTYFLRTFFSPYYRLTSAEFVELVAAQQQPALIWERISFLVNESGDLNGRQPVPEAGIPDYLLGTEGGAVYESLAAPLTEAVQEENIVAGTTFVIPPHLASRFYKPAPVAATDFPPASDPSLSPEGDAGPGPDPNAGPGIEADPSVYFYPEKDLTGKQLNDLVDAQPDRAGLWERIKHGLEYNDDIPQLAPSEYAAFMEGDSAIPELPAFASTICSAIADRCNETKTVPVVPAYLTDYFGPSLEEAKRISARRRLETEAWRLELNDKGWELYFFEPTGLPDTGARAESVHEAVFPFGHLLRDIAAFARKIESPIQEAFLLGQYFLGQTIPPGDFDAAHLLAIKKDLKKEGFSAQALMNAGNVFATSAPLFQAGWSDERTFGLMACDISDVFGGMGSWNDIYVGSPGDQETYQRLTADTFQAMKKYFEALLSGS